MSCCSNRRAALGSVPQLRAAAYATPAAAAQRLRYLGQAPISLRGPHSGRVYSVDAAAHELAVDARDLEALLRTGLFQRCA